MFILNEEGNHSRIFLSRGISTAFFCMFTGMKIVSSIFAYSYFLFLQLLFLHDKINLSSLKSFSKGEEQKFLPNVSRENPLEQPRLQNSIWHTKLRVELSFLVLWYIVLDIWQNSFHGSTEITSIFTIQFHDLDLSMHAYYIFYEQDHDLQKVKLDQIAICNFLHCHKEIQSPCGKLKIQKCHKFNWETPSCTIEHIFFKKLLVRETTKHFPIFLPLVNETLFKAYLTPRNSQEKWMFSS